MSTPATQLLSLTQRWKLDVPPPLEIRTAGVPTLTFALSTTQALQAFAVGQGQLTVSPLQMSLVAATIGNGGFMPAPFVVKDIKSTDDDWMPFSGSARRPPEPIIAPETARAVLGAMRVDGNTTGHGGAAVSGNRQHSWFIGLAPIDQPRYAIAVLLETPQGDAATEAEKIGRAVLEELLSMPSS